jgi:hypothetical protein
MRSYDLETEVEGLTEKPITLDVRKDLIIGGDLEKEAREAAAWFGYYAVLSERAQSRLKKCKLAFEIWQARASEAMEITLAEKSKSKKRPTQRAIQEALRLQPKFKAFELEVIKATEKAGIMNKWAIALQEKKGLIQTLCANRRKESY